YRGRHRDGPLGIRLGRTRDEVAADDGQCLGDLDRPCEEIDAADPQSTEFSGPKTRVRGELNENAKRLRDSSCEGVDLLDVQEDRILCNRPRQAVPRCGILPDGFGVLRHLHDETKYQHRLPDRLWRVPGRNEIGDEPPDIDPVDATDPTTAKGGKDS